MKSFKHYLTESVIEYNFRMKFADLPEDFDIGKLETALEKYSVGSVSKPKKTPIQQHPADFQTLQNAEVYIIDATVAYPVTAVELHNYLHTTLGVAPSHLVVINKDHPEEIAREEQVDAEDEEYETALGNDYKDDGIKANEYFGDEYNANLLKELTSDREEVQAEGGNTPAAKTLADEKQGTDSPISGGEK